MDPLTRDYPMLTPYQFASNRPIDGIDLDGLEWTKSTNSESGKTEIQVNMSLDVYKGMTSATQTAILNETNFLFNSMLDKASGGMAQINVTFNNERVGNKNFVPGFKIVGDLQSGGYTGAY